MSAAQLLAHARALGIELHGVGGKLHYEAPAGQLTPELRKALSAHKAAILDILEAERVAARHLVRCCDCSHYIPSPSLNRANDVVWTTPGGCTENRTFPDARPPIYPCTGWYCDGWTPATTH